MTQTVKIDNRFFIFGYRFEIVGVIYKILDCNDCVLSYRHELYGKRLPFYITTIDNVDYQIPGIAAVLVHDEKDPSLYHRTKHFLESLEGESGIKDHVAAAKNYLGIDMTRVGPDINMSYVKYMPIRKTERIIPMITENLEEQINASRDIVYKNTIQKPKVIIDIVSATIQSGNVLQYGIALNIEPTESVTVTITSSEEYLIIEPTTLIFTKDNFNFEQNVMFYIESGVGVPSDAIAEITHTAEGGQFSNIVIDKVSILIKADPL